MKRIGIAIFLTAAVLALTAPAGRASMEQAQQAFVERDYETAFRLWRDEADDGDPVAAFNVAQMYRRGLGVAENQQQAERYMRQAADAGNPAAQGRLGTMLFFKSQQAEIEEAIEWWRKGAQSGNPHAQYSYGVILGNGDYVEQNLPESYYWLSLAAEAGDEEAARARQVVARKMDDVAIERVNQRLDSLGIDPPPAARSDPAPAQTSAAESPPPRQPAPEPRPAAEPSSEAPPESESAADRSPYAVQLAAFARRDQAEDFWQRMQARHETMFAGYSTEIVRADLGGERGTVYRVRVRGFFDASAAKFFCNDLKAVGETCFVARR